jgi:hypothetical protein
MFQISRLEDTNVKILPENLGKPRLEAITQEIESLYMDKVRQSANTGDGAAPPAPGFHAGSSLPRTASAASG